MRGLGSRRRGQHVLLVLEQRELETLGAVLGLVERDVCVAVHHEYEVLFGRVEFHVHW